MKLIIASNNAHKIYEIKKMLGSKFSEILSLADANIVHETVEDGETFLENAFKKAREIAAISGCASLADDSGICVDALDGAPGVYSARFSGGTDEDNNKLLLDALRVCDADEVKIELNSGSAPILILPTQGDNFLFLILPMRFKKD